jgi:carboxypeptidase Q
MRYSRLVVLSLFFLLALPAVITAQDAKRGPATPEERQRFVAITHKMEAAPLDESLHSEREWALKWLVDVPDISVSVCIAPIDGPGKKKYKYSPELMVQLTYSSAAFIIEHPEQAKDADAQHLAGVEGAVKAYQSILRTKPNAKSEAMEGLLEKQHDGKLADYVQETWRANCN